MTTTDKIGLAEAKKENGVHEQTTIFKVCALAKQMKLETTSLLKKAQLAQKAKQNILSLNEQLKSAREKVKKQVIWIFYEASVIILFYELKTQSHRLQKVAWEEKITTAQKIESLANDLLRNHNVNYILKPDIKKQVEALLEDAVEVLIEDERQKLNETKIEMKSDIDFTSDASQKALRKFLKAVHEIHNGMGGNYPNILNEKMKLVYSHLPSEATHEKANSVAKLMGGDYSEMALNVLNVESLEYFLRSYENPNREPLSSFDLSLSQKEKQVVTAFIEQKRQLEKQLEKELNALKQMVQSRKVLLVLHEKDFDTEQLQFIAKKFNSASGMALMLVCQNETKAESLFKQIKNNSVLIVTQEELRQHKLYYEHVIFVELAESMGQLFSNAIVKKLQQWLSTVSSRNLDLEKEAERRRQEAIFGSAA